MPVTVTVLAPNGTPLTGRPISLVGPSQSTFTPADGVTDGAGTFATSFRLNKPWATPGSSALITAVSESGSGSATFTVLGANMLLTDGIGVTQAPTQFTSPIVRTGTGPFNELVVLRDGTLWVRGTNSNDPFVKVQGISGALDIAASSAYTGTFYVLKDDGTVWAWGDNRTGQIDQTGINQDTPVQIGGLSNVIKIAASSGALYALKSDKTLWAQGQNNAGKAGVGTTTTPIPLTQVVGGTDVVDVAGRWRGGLLVKSDGSVWSWGEGEAGYIGDGTTTTQLAPIKLVSPTNVTSVTAHLMAVSWGAFVIFAIDATGAAWVWGDNSTGAYGNGTTTHSLTPIKIAGVSNVAQVICGPVAGVYALKNDGSLLTWGRGASTPTPWTPPRPITRLPTINEGAYSNRIGPITSETTVSVDVTQAQVAAGTAGTVVTRVAAGSSGVAGATVTLTTTAGALAAASGTTSPSGVFQTTITPDVWTSPGAVVRVTAGDDTGTSSDTFTVLGANLAGTGSNDRGQVLGKAPGAGEEHISTVRQTATVFPSPVIDVTVSGLNGSTSLALLADGTVWAVGHNDAGQLGMGDQSSRSTWTQIPGLPAIASIWTEGWSSYAVDQNGDFWSWGESRFSLLGEPLAQNRLSPAKVAGLSGVKAFYRAESTSCIVQKNDGTWWAWGWNGNGLLAMGNTVELSTPTRVTALDGFTSLANSFGYGFIGLKADGTVWGWGGNADGQLCDGTTNSASLPIQIPGLSNIVEITAGTGDSYPEATGYARASNGTVWGWGKNHRQQVDNSGQTNLTTPVQVTGPTNPTHISATYASLYALQGDGTLWYRGASANNNSNTTGTTVAVPRPIQKMTTVYHARAGRQGIRIVTTSS
ncbi:hypothetical protein ASG45_07255 [Microbacterium sp. Leaf436]|nr:hypothetical protein ASG45_07255 [Microbacterium sp. Leaf436]